MKKYLPILAILIGLVVFIGATNHSAFAATIEELQAQIQKLLEAIRMLQSQIQVNTTTPSIVPPVQKCPFVSIMYLGYSKTPTNEVKELQKLLKDYPDIYPERLVTGYFGKLTDTALRRFQQQYGVAVTGQTDPETRAKLCELWQQKQNPQTIGNCGWCGTACIKKTTNTYCPDVMPPEGTICQEINGVCQITKVTPTTIETCAKEGEIFSPVYDSVPKHCCSGLTEWMSGMDSRIVQNGKCVETGLLKGSPTGTCIKCGDGICGLNENICNCPQDCSTTTTTTVPTCTDSDGGNNIFVKGTVTYKGQTYTDSCVNSATVLEYSCVNNNVVQNSYVCPAGYTCQDGACIPVVTTTTTTTVPTCTDSDGGNNIFVKGTVTYKGQIHTDFCPIIIPSGIPSQTEVYEFYCENGVMKEGGISCPTNYTCQDGACIPVVTTTTTTTVPTCTDSDGGNNIFVKGTVTYNGKTNIDSCIDPLTVLEYSCVNNQVASIATSCPTNYTCQDGACRPTVITTINPPTLTAKCYDGTTCGWCGNQCTKITAGMNCPQVTPPLGASCVCNENNSCVITPLTSASLPLSELLNKLTASLMSLIEMLKK